VNTTTADRSDVGQVTINKFSDDVLLEIFDFYRHWYIPFLDFVWNWQKLAQVCRRWRRIIFASPQRLKLSVSCDGLTRTRTLLDIWPPFPISVHYPRWLGHHRWTVVDDRKVEENVIAALENHVRITHIRLTDLRGSTLRRFVAVMLEPFITLTHLALHSNERTAPVLREAFLGGSSPHLRSFDLEGIAFPSLPISSDLVYWDIPTSGYISPEAMATSLAPLANLETLFLGFSSPQPRPNQLIPPPLARVVLPALTRLSFRVLGRPRLSNRYPRTRRT